MMRVLRHPSTWLAVLWAVALGLLIGGGERLLEYPLPGGLPFGNALVPFGLVCGALAGCVYSRPGTLLRLLATVSFALAVFWLPVGLLLSGNLNLNFNGDQAFLMWSRFNVISVGLVVATLLATVAVAIRDRWVPHEA